MCYLLINILRFMKQTLSSNLGCSCAVSIVSLFIPSKGMLANIKLWDVFLITRLCFQERRAACRLHPSKMRLGLGITLEGAERDLAVAWTQKCSAPWSCEI